LAFGHPFSLTHQSDFPFALQKSDARECTMTFTKLTDTLFVSPQISANDVAVAAGLGVTLIINNRPEGEADDQPPGADIAQAAATAGLAYVAIPITHSGFSEPQVQAMADALNGLTGKALAYCRSGTRSTLLWALAESAQGGDADALTNMAAKAGYDVSPVRPLMDMLKARA
jgi:uncharacterized protein (TIGR01244 family)